MSKVPVPTAKEINEAHERAKSFAENAVGWAIKCGQMLARKKQQLGRGEFDEWVKTYCDFGRSSAYAYLKVADKSSNALEDFRSIQQALGYEKPKKISATSSRGLDDSSESLTGAKPAGAVESKTPAPAAPPVSPPSAAVELSTAPSNEGEGAATAAADQPQWTEADEAEANATAEIEYANSIAKVMAADDRLAAAHVEIKRQAAEIAVLKVSRDGYMNGKEQAIKLLKAEQRKVARLEKELKQSGRRAA